MSKLNFPHIEESFQSPETGVFQNTVAPNEKSTKNAKITKTATEKMICVV